MSLRLRRHLALLLTVLAGLALSIGPIGSAAGDGEAGTRPGDNAAIAINTEDGSSVFKLAFEIRRVTGAVVDNQNAAVAYASCTSCQTVAIAIQVLLVVGSPTTFTPTNVAVAVNQSCNLCRTMALAYQFAVGVDASAHFTEQGMRDLQRLRRELERLGKSGLSIDEIRARTADIVARISEIIRTRLVATRPREGDGGDQAGSQDQTGPGNDPTTTTPTQTTTVTPTETTPATSTAQPPPTGTGTDTTQTAPPPATTAPAPGTTAPASTP